MSAKQANAAQSNGKPVGRKSLLLDFLEKSVCVITSDGRSMIGVMRGFDQVCNVVLEKCVERIFAKDKGVEIVPLGLHVIRGDNIAMVGEVDADRDAKIEWGNKQVR